jgi:Flp pilus assembly protein TadG
MTMMLRPFLSDTRAAAAAEMALLLPLLLVLLFVTFEGGYFLWNEHKVVKGVRDGARYAGRQGFSDFSGCPQSTGASAAFGGSSLQNIQEVTRTGKISGGTPMVTGWLNSHVAVTCDFVAGSTGLYGANGGNAPRVTVSASVPYPPSPLSTLATTLGFDTSAINLNASAQSPVMGL